MAKQKTLGQDFIAGGDLIFHRLALGFANIARLSIVGFVVASVVFWIAVALFVNRYDWYLFYKTVAAIFWRFTPFLNHNHSLDFVNEYGVLVNNSPAAAIVKHVFSTPVLYTGFFQVLVLGALSIAVAVLTVLYLSRIYMKIGEKAQKDEFLRGQKLVTADELADMVMDPSPIRIGNVSIPISGLARNVLANGSMGVGKSVVISQMIEDARAWGKKMVIYDKTGELTQKYFRPGKDQILNPVDYRCADWSINADLRKITDAAMVSRFFVPENKKSADPVWDNAARMLLEDIITIVQKQNGTMDDVRRIVTQYKLEDMHELLDQHNAPSTGVINPSNERGSESVRLTLTAQPAIRFFTFFDKNTSKFSVRDFIRQDDDACLFLVSNPTQHEAIRPFVSAWIELALVEAMSMPPTTDIRLMFFLDELASLSKIKAFDIAFTEARKFGICSVVGIQNLAQMDEIYGEDMTKVFIANLQNKIILRTEEESSAKRLADTLGKEEVAEVNQGLSFGVESSRDGVNLSDKREERHLVTPTELMVLPDLTGYVKLAGAYPIARVSYEYKKRPDVSEGFIERAGLDLPDTVSATPVKTVDLPEPDQPTTKDESASTSASGVSDDELPNAW